MERKLHEDNDERETPVKEFEDLLVSFLDLETRSSLVALSHNQTPGHILESPQWLVKVR